MANILIDDFFTDVNKKSYFKSSLTWFKDRLIEVGLTAENIYVLHEGMKLKEIDSIPCAIIWCFNSKPERKIISGGFYSDTKRYYIVEIIYNDVETMESMSDNLHKLMLRTNNIQHYDDRTMDFKVVAVEPIVSMETPITSCLFYVMADYEIEGLKEILEFPIETFTTLGYMGGSEYTENP